MEIGDCASLFGRHEFFIRRLHSLTGLLPVGGYLVFHLATNASILDGVGTYQYRVDQIHSLGPTTILLLEWPLIFLPILFHGVVGVFIVCRGKRNVVHYPHLANIRYTLQRWTGMIAFVFILWHVFQMHGWFKFEAWEEWVAKPLGGDQFDPEHAFSAAKIIQSSVLMLAAYAIGVAACVYHFTNGVWTTGITWGLWTSPRAQHWANVLVALVGLFMVMLGGGALVGMETARPPAQAAGAVAAKLHATAPPLPDSRVTP